MFYVPTWITNVLLLATIYLSGFQHVRLKRRNPVTNVQFIMIVFALFMMIMVTLYNRTNPWLSTGFFVIAVASLLTMLRQFRMMPPMRSIE